MKGRSKLLIEKRNEDLLKRYHYWTEVKRLRFDDTLKVLSEQEFYISEPRIMAIIRENINKLDDIKVKPVPRIRMPRKNKGQV